MSKSVRWIIPVLIVLLLGSAAIYKIFASHHHIWLSDYLFSQDFLDDNGEEIIDVIYLVVDHWEPGDNVDIVNFWISEYRKMAYRHIDSDGEYLKHTFFYPIERFRGYQIDSLVNLCSEDVGEIEVHLHHYDVGEDSLRKIYQNGLDSLKAHGALLSPDDQTHFAFIHGNFALDNSRYKKKSVYCGVNNEISMLLELVCYADFTFPALMLPAQQSMVNKIFYAVDDPDRPKSYNTGVISRKGLKTNPDQLMIFQGPFIIDWTDWRFKTHPTIDDGDLYRDMMPSPNRLDLWFKANVRVKDGPAWIFVRPFTHGCSKKSGGIKANLSEAMDSMLTAAEQKYRDSSRYRLHYMTAREAYNVVKAAEDGHTGNPNDYRDYILKPYLYQPVQELISQN